MRRALRLVLLLAWVVLASLALGRWWMLRPDTLWQRVMERFNPRCCEAVADVEALVVLATALAVVLAVTGIGWLIWRRLRLARA